MSEYMNKNCSFQNINTRIHRWLKSTRLWLCCGWLAPTPKWQLTSRRAGGRSWVPKQFWWQWFSFSSWSRTLSETAPHTQWRQSTAQHKGSKWWTLLLPLQNDRTQWGRNSPILPQLLQLFQRAQGHWFMIVRRIFCFYAFFSQSFRKLHTRNFPHLQ